MVILSGANRTLVLSQEMPIGCRFSSASHQVHTGVTAISVLCPLTSRVCVYSVLDFLIAGSASAVIVVQLTRRASFRSAESTLAVLHPRLKDLSNSIYKPAAVKCAC